MATVGMAIARHRKVWAMAERLYWTPLNTPDRICKYLFNLGLIGFVWLIVGPFFV